MPELGLIAETSDDAAGNDQDTDDTFKKNQLGFDESTIRAFTLGDCWRLAMELHRKLNYRVFVVTELEIVLADRPISFFHHMFVFNPHSGKFLDVDGEHTENAMISRYSHISDYPVVYDVTKDLNEDVRFITAYPQHDPDIVADSIIERLGLNCWFASLLN